MGGTMAVRRCLGIVTAAAIGVITSLVIAPSASPASAMTVDGTYADNFGAQSYTNNNGTLNFAGAWDENGDGVDSPTAGVIQIASNALRFIDLDDADSIARLANLGSVGATKEVVLSFNWVSEGGSGESLAVELRNSASTWVQVATLSNSSGHQPLPATVRVQLAPDQIASASGIRFRATNGWDSDDQFVIDDVALTVGDIQANPDLAPSCGIDVMLVLDESGSINNAGATAQVESAVNAFAAGLNNTTSRLRLAEFSTNGRLASIGGNTGYRQVNGSPDPAINTYLTTGGNAELATNYNPGTGQQYTNWEAGLSVAAGNLGTGKLVVFMTDGQPNTVGTDGSSGDDNGPGEGAGSAGAAIDELEAIKAAGAHVLAIGVGDASNDSNFDLLTRTVEPNNAQVWEEADGGLPDLRVVDSIRVSSFGALENALRRVVFALCSPSVTITKVNDANAPIAGWDFTGEVDVAPTGGGTDQYQWMVPALGVTADNGSGNDGGAGSAAARTRTTNASGQALFQWAPNTVADPQPWNSTFRYTETLPAGWTLAASQQACTVQRLNDNGTVTQTTNTPTSSVNGQIVTFTLTGIQKGDIVNCTVKNNRPAQITITKAIVPGPSSADDFNFTGGLGSFALDVDGNAALPSTRTFSVPAGSYTVTESDPAANYWKLTGLQCGSVSGTASGTPNVPGRSVAITVAAGSAITCTFTNTKVPAPALSVVKTASVPSFTEKAGSVTYTVQVSNPNGTANPVLVTDEDDLVVLEGAPGVAVELNTPTLPLPYPGGQITANTCDDLDGQTVAASPISCTFTVAYSNRNSGDTIDDTVTVKGTDTFGNPVQASDPATVEVTNVAPQISVVKSNKEPVALVAPGGNATYTVQVTNPAGAVENLILTGVNDVMQKNGGAFGSLDLTTDNAPLTNNTCNDAGNVLVGTVLSPGQSYNCEFTVNTTAFGSLAQDDQLRNVVTVTGRDDDPTPQTVQGTDDAIRTVLGEPPKLVVFKTDNNAQIVEPDDDIVYDITITNASTTESVTVTRIVDAINFNGAPVGTLTVEDNPVGGAVEVTFTPAGAGSASLVGTTCASPSDGDGGIGSVLAANGGSTTCKITLNLKGDAGDIYDDKVVVDGIDQSGDPVSAENTADTPVVNAMPSIAITKTPSPSSVPETGGSVSFTLQITNTSVSTDPLTLKTLTDTIFGDLFDAANTAVSTNNCVAKKDTVLAPGGSTSCTFSASLVGNVATPHHNTVTIQAIDDENNQAQDDDDATVTFTDVLPVIDVTKTADPTSVVESGGSVVYTIQVVNKSAEPVTITSLTDDKFDLAAAPTTCGAAVGTVLAAYDGAVGGADTYSCQITRTVAQVGSETSHTNIATAVATDDEQNPATDNDDEVVTFTLILPTVDITKTDNDAAVQEPGGDVTYHLTIVNTSFEPVTITTLTDTITYADPPSVVGPFSVLTTGPQVSATTCGDDVALAGNDGAPGGADEVTCQFTVHLTGTAQIVADRVDVTVVDNDQQPGDDSAEDTTPITDRPVDVSITKTANPTVIVEGDSTTYTFVITNLADWEPLYVTSLVDDKFGDLSGIGTCAVVSEATPLVIAAAGQYTCTALLAPDFASQPIQGTHTNVVTVEGFDDEGLNTLGGENEAPPVTDSDDETVHASATIRVQKVANPGGEQDFQFNVTGEDSQTTTSAGGYEQLVFDDLAEGAYRVSETPVDGWALDDITCAKDGDKSGSGIDLDIAWGDDVLCTFHNTKLGEVTVSKSLKSGPTQIAGTNKYALTYEVVVSNGSFADETFEVSDLPTLPPGATVTVGSITSDSAAVNLDTGWDGTGDLTDGPQPIAGRTVAAPSTVTITIPVTVTLPGGNALTGECGAQPGGERVVLNAVDLASTEATPDDEVCTPLPNPNIDMTKSVVGSASLDPVTGEWTIVYEIVVENSGDGPGEYDIDDEFGFGAGVHVQSVAATVVGITGQTDPAGPTGAHLNPGFDGDSDIALIAGVDIVGHAIHTYRVTVTATIDEPVVGAGVCDVETGENGGFLNTATLTANGEAQGPDRACDDFSTLRLVKHVDNGDGGNLQPGDFHLTATPVDGEDAVVAGNGDVIAAVPAGSYELAESALAGYVPGTWSCSVVGSDAVPTTGDTVAVPQATDVVCDITNDDQPVDLELTKDDGGVVAQAGGAAFPYTITVSNVGDRDADTDEPVTVTDVLPDAFQWVSFPDDPTASPVCAQAGQELTCSIDPADLTAGATVEIVASVQALASTPAGTYTNKAWVTTDDDPICPASQEQPVLTIDAELDAAPCTPPCPEGESSNNVDCENTPVDNTATIVVDKVDNVADGVDVEPGQSFTYAITVHNNGPQPVDNIRITDAIPSALVLVSTSGANWDCSATSGSNVDCDYGPQLAAGATSTPLTVSVTLKASFVGDNIHNVAVGTADVVKPEGPFEDESVTDDDDEDTPARSLDIQLLTSDCVKDAPFVNYSINPLGFTPTPGATATVTIYRLGTDTVIRTITDLPLSGRFLYPGAAVDGEGNGTDWPGWKLENGEWVLDDSDAFLRDGVRVVVSVNPTAEATVGYPAASAACASPESTMADMAIVKTASVPQVGAGGGFSWILSVTNNGPDPAFGVVVGDIVPASLQVTGVQSAEFNCSTNGNSVSCTKATMAVGEKGTVTINVSVPASAPDGSIQNIGTVESNLPDPDLTNNSDDASVDIVAQQAPTTTLPPVVLPPTGSNSTKAGLQLAAIAVLLGGVALLVTRRRRTQS